MPKERRSDLMQLNPRQMLPRTNPPPGPKRKVKLLHTLQPPPKVLLTLIIRAKPSLRTEGVRVVAVDGLVAGGYPGADADFRAGGDEPAVGESEALGGDDAFEYAADYGMHTLALMS